MTNTLNDTKYVDRNVTSGAEVTSRAKAAPGAEYDYVLSFFKKVMKDPSAALSFAEAIYEVSAAAQIPVLDLLETLNVENEMLLDESMAYYLNGIRSKTTLLGVENPVRPNYYAGRQVLG